MTSLRVTSLLLLTLMSSLALLNAHGWRNRWQNRGRWWSSSDSDSGSHSGSRSGYSHDHDDDADCSLPWMGGKTWLPSQPIEFEGTVRHITFYTENATYCVIVRKNLWQVVPGFPWQVMHVERGIFHDLLRLCNRLHVANLTQPERFCGVYNTCECVHIATNGWDLK